MATKKENAALLKERLGVQIDSAASEPKADLLEGWAGRTETEGDAVKQEILTWQLQKALGIELSNSAYSAEQLEGWLNRAATDADVVRAEVQAPAPQASPSTPAPEASGSTVLEQQPAETEQADAPAGEVVVAATPPVQASASTAPKKAPKPTAIIPTPAPAQSAASQAPLEEASSEITPQMLTVRLNDVVAGFGGTYSDPEQDEGQRVIQGTEPVQVRVTTLIATGLREGTLVQAD